MESPRRGSGVVPCSMTGVVVHNDRPGKRRTALHSFAWQDAASMGRLDDVDLGLELKKSEQDDRLEELGDRLQDLRLRCAGLRGSEKLGKTVCVVFEGWDAPGTGGATTRPGQHPDLRHVRVRQFQAPTWDERRHNYLDRFVPVL